MTYPHNFDPANAPLVYLYRQYVASRPNQITFSAMVGSFRMHIIDLCDDLNHFIRLSEETETVIKRYIKADEGNHITRLYGAIKHYVLVIDAKPIAKYTPDGTHVGAADDINLVPIHTGVRVGDDGFEVRLK